MAGSMVALLATTLEFLACGFFKVAAKRMEPLRGTRPIRVLSLAVRSPYWLVGMLLILAGIVLQFLSLTFIPLSSANPLYLTPLLVLLVMAVGYFHERLTRREWLSLGLLAIATLVIAVSVAHGEHAGKALPSYALFFAVVIPCVVIPLIVFSVGDLRQTGRHARPIAGIAYGASIGVLIGTGQLAAVGLFNAYQSGLRGTALLQEPYLWAMVLSAGFGLGQILIALQRCRMAIVITVNSVVGQTQLVVMATLLYGEGWPHDRLWSLVRAGGFALGIAAIFIFPRHEPDPEESGAHEMQPGPSRQASAARGPYA